MMHPTEAIVLKEMVFDFTNVRLFGRNPLTYTRCNRKVDGQTVIVGGYGSAGLNVHINSFVSDCCGAACALRKAIGTLGITWLDYIAWEASQPPVQAF